MGQIGKTAAAESSEGQTTLPSLPTNWRGTEKPHLNPGVPHLRLPAELTPGLAGILPCSPQLRTATAIPEAALEGKMARKRAVAPLRLLLALPPPPT